MLASGSSAQKKRSGFLPVLLFGLLIASSLFLFLMMRKKSTPDESILNMLVDNGADLQTAKLFLAQAKHETNNFTSSGYTRYNNMFGMGVPVKRESARSGEYESNEGLKSAFANPYDSVKDMILWANYTNFPLRGLTPQRFVSKLKERGYFTDSESNYLAGINRFL